MLSKVTLQVPLAWLGALPEAVVRARKEGASDDDVIRFKIILKVPYYFFTFALLKITHSFPLPACWEATLMQRATRGRSVVKPSLTPGATLRFGFRIQIHLWQTLALNSMNLIHDCMTYLVPD